MTGKPSLYELLGLNDKASPEQIQQAYEACRQALESQPESEERHNRLAILQDARDVLNDRRQRAGYDRRQRDRREGDRRQPTAEQSTRWIGPLLASLLIAAIAYPTWRYLTPKPVATDSLATAPLPAPTATPQTASADREPEAVSTDIAALLPPTVPAAQRSAMPSAPQPLFQDSTLAKFSDSTYLIIGKRGLGTGVAIAGEMLLTNCHVIAPNVLKGPIFAINPATRQKTLIVAAAFLITEDACVAHAPGLNGKPIEMGNAAQLARGAPIYNIGFAQGQLIASRGSLLGVINRRGQNFIASTNYCDHGVSGGPLVDQEGRLVGLTSGGPEDRSVCFSLTAETARRVLDQTLIAIDAFPTDYTSNLQRHW